MGKTVSVVIPTLNAEKFIDIQLQKLSTQDYPITEIIVVDSASEDHTVEICKKHNVHLIQIQRKDFNHAKTRDMVLRQCETDVVVFLTQDAIPYNNQTIGNLVKALGQDSVVIATGRQVARNDASAFEKLIREFNYPAKSSVKSKADIKRLGIKTFFFSDSFAAYDRKIYLELGGFEKTLKTNEDMFYAAKVIQSGYKVAYVAEAKVLHSHNFTLKQQYKRNYIEGYEVEKHKELLGNVSQESEGLKLVKYVSKGLLLHGRVLSFIHFGFDCVVRLMGSKAGRKAYLNGKD